MVKVNESEKEYRFGDSGPKYLRKGPFLSAGVVVFNPGQDFACHYHQVMEESFLIVEGELDFYINNELVKCVEGDLITAEPGDSHYIKNTGSKIAKAVFMLAPFQEQDKYVVED
ncbi:Cupin domain-containing protein [Anaerovirgula multivorans]|uniref:Cupin domain-containing protein n=1 Tax=Anaerovirgula multivorans TaxID=312168 RepID=A0A239JXM5_9FIRM|nr:cupin domain-containing protein [Anaerovirgula multivorans]SNT10409.1 Cupin domain-containing protein [Anaerovirgula multivorans]